MNSPHYYPLIKIIFLLVLWTHKTLKFFWLSSCYQDAQEGSASQTKQSASSLGNLLTCQTPLFIPVIRAPPHLTNSEAPGIKHQSRPSYPTYHQKDAPIWFTISALWIPLCNILFQVVRIHLGNCTYCALTAECLWVLDGIGARSFLATCSPIEAGLHR